MPRLDPVLKYIHFKVGFNCVGIGLEIDQAIKDDFQSVYGKGAGTNSRGGKYSWQGNIILE